ncbi:stage III sporulation protein AC [Clostridium mediterraneense]|uniref:stage III sporulation protein AC n=1 Tax=Clostridium mediterraneense TaxID=1805472 RepID=UPI0008372336|nr:stage III sporulation protein AC [Clostridium mediterraneense]
MVDLDLIFKLGGIGIILVILDKVLSASGKSEIATLINLTGIVIILTMVVVLISNLFNSVKTMFTL